MEYLLDEGWASDLRDRLFSNQINGLRLTEIINGARILDIGSGWGHPLSDFFIKYSKEFINLDIEPDNLRKIDNGSTKRLGDARNLPFIDGAMDVVTTCAFFNKANYLDYYEIPKIFSEIYRVLKNGGYFIAFAEDESVKKFMETKFQNIFPVFEGRSGMMSRYLYADTIAQK